MTRVVAVSGAGGFIGAHLTRALAARGDRVLPLMRAGGMLDAPHEPVDAVVHLAFPTSAALRRGAPVEALASAIGATLAAVSRAASAGARHLVIASSGKVYAPPARLPIEENFPLVPTTFLGELKLACERLAGLSARRGTTFGVSALRIFNVYGPGQRDEFIVAHLLAALGRARVPVGELEHGRDYLHVKDVCDAIVTALAHPPAIGEVRAMNVASGRATTPRELARLLETASGRALDLVVDPARLRPGEVVEERACARALTELGWAPRITLAEGLAELARAAR